MFERTGGGLGKTKRKTEGKAHEMNRKLVKYRKKEMRGTHAGIAYGETHRKTYSETHVK